MKKLLFVTEKWCDGNPDVGLTNSSHNLFGSFQNSKFVKNEEWEFKTIHFDEISLKGKHIDDFAQQIYEKMKPDLVIVTLLGTMSCNPTERFFKVFKDAGCKVVFLWPDFGRDWTLNSCNRFKDFTDLNVAIACERNTTLPNVLWTWTPEDPSLFYFDGFDKKDIDVLFLGTNHSPERNECLNMLKNNLPKDLSVYLGGGQRQEKLSHEKYAELTRRAKIVINFPFSVAGNDQLKGRVFEATSCGSLLLERNNQRTLEFFMPGKEYITYETPLDLLEKIKFFTKEQPELREKIALAGLKRFNEDWNHDMFWDSLLKEVEKVKK